MDLLTLLPKKKKTTRPRPARPAPVVYAPKLVPSQHAVPSRLLQKLAALRRKYCFVHAGTGLARALSVAVMLLTLQMALDWLVNLPFLTRAVLLAGDIWLIVFFLRKQLLPLILHPPGIEACALMVEKHWPKLRGRIIATVQFARPSYTADSPELVQALQQETNARTIQMNFSELILTRPLLRYAAAAVVLTVLWVGLFFAVRPGSVALLERVFLLPAKVPRKTEVVCLSGDKVIPAGDSVALEAQAVGIIPSHGLLTMKDDTGRIQDITLDPEPDRADHFGLKIASVQRPFTYTIQLNDGVSDSFQVKTVPRPNVTSIECTQVYPAYTGLAPIKRTVGNLALLAGSRLQIHATANSTVVQPSLLKLIGIDQTRPLAIGGSDGRDLTGEFEVPATGLTGFSVQLTNQTGVTSGDETQYRVDLIPDRPPVIQITYPQRLQELYTLQAKPTIAFVASDDFGLVKVSLCYRVTEGDATTDDTTGAAPLPPKTIEMDLGTDHPLSMKNQYLWDLTSLQPPLAAGSTLEYWMTAEDGNNVTGPGRSESEHHTIKIVSDLEKKEEVMNRLMDSLSTITDISQSEQKINKGLGDIIQGKKDQK